MRVDESLADLAFILLPPSGPPVLHQVARELGKELAPGAALIREAGPAPALRLALGPVAGLPAAAAPGDCWGLFRLDPGGGGLLAASHPALLHALFRLVAEEWRREPAAAFAGGRVVRPAFAEQRPLFDLFLTQVWRTMKGWDREAYVAELARLGYTHLEVNGLAAPWPFEPGVPGECLHRFYTYCPALDQFVASRLNRGIYPTEYLDANLARLRRDAALARRYGLAPSLLCFEPRSVPETLLRKYPMLRGARVDHPFRSLKPRYNLTTAHPAVREHYAEMMRRLLEEVPDLDCLEIWSNDSGAAFEHTASLYAGRNGGAYLVREWRTPEQVARAAGENMLAFLRTLRDAAREVNPAFRVILRAEPFWAERQVLEEGLEEGLDLSVSSLLTDGWDLPYHHPLYEEVKTVGTTLYHHRFHRAERPRLEELAARGCRVRVMHAHGAFGNFEPLLMVPAPWLTLEKLGEMRAAGVARLGHLGGALPRELVPFPVNQEVWRLFQFEPGIDPEEAVTRLARRWAGERLASELVEAWRLVEEAVRAFPVPVHLYLLYGFVWYRLWTRPLVPDIEAIPEADREYCERHMLVTPHNPQRVDLMKDVLFDLTDPERCRRAVARIDDRLAPPLAAARERVGEVLAREPEMEVFADLAVRLRALACWFETSRNVAAWIGGVHGGPEHRGLVREAVVRERENAAELLRLWEESGVAFMACDPEGETTFLHGGDFGAQLRRKIELMTGREDDEPRVDPDYMWRLSAPE